MQEFLFTEKYRPHTVEDCILSDELKAQFQSFVDTKNIPNLILVGPPGTGKTTVARAMLDEIDADYLFINGSLDVGKDTLRSDIRAFASAVSFKGNTRKYVILDEADYLHPAHVQPALRAFIEEFSSNCGFILTCNYPRKIIDALHSRLTTIVFKHPNNEKPQLAEKMLAGLKKILDQEKIPHKDAVLAQLIIKNFPDMRTILNTIQSYAIPNKVVDAGILKQTAAFHFAPLVAALKAKKYQDIRKWVNDNEIDAEFYKEAFDNISTFVKPTSLPQLVVFAADYQYKAAFALDQEINALAFLVECMAELEYQ